MIHYPIAPHRQACYPAFHGHDLPLAEQMAREVLSLPMSPTMNEQEVAHVIASVRQCAG